MKSLSEMPVEQPEDLAHARWRVRFFKHLVEEHGCHPYPQLRDSVWELEDANYREHLARAEAVLAEMEEAAPPTNITPFPEAFHHQGSHEHVPLSHAHGHAHEHDHHDHLHGPNG